MRRILAALALSALLSSTAAAQIGVNTALATPANTEAAWANVTRTMAPWVAADPLNEYGYPTGPARTYATLAGYPSGVYEAGWQGTARVTFSGQGITAVSTGPNSAEITVADGHGHLNVSADGLDPANPFRWLRVIAPGMKHGPFRGQFLDIIAPFDHVRVMEWMRTNGNTAVRWSDRTQPDSFLRTGPTGVTYEDICALAWHSGKPLWVCIPWGADDDYVAQMAALFGQFYPPGLTLTVECSNEVWNLADEQGRENYLACGSDYGAAARSYADRLARMAAVWSAAWCGEPGRVRFVMTGQTGSTYWLRTALDECRSVGWVPDAIAIAPYVYLPKTDDVDGLTLDGLFAGMEDNLASKVAPGIQAHAALAAEWGLPLWSYEGGQALIARDGFNEPVKAAAQNDVRMARIHAALNTAWVSAGGTAYTHYCLATDGSEAWWGLLTDGGQSGSVKYDGMTALIAGP